MSIASSDSNFDNVLATIYTAALGDHSEWNHVLEVISKHINANYCEFLLNDKIVASHPFQQKTHNGSATAHHLLADQYNSKLHQHPVMQKIFFSDNQQTDENNYKTSLEFSEDAIVASMVFSKKEHAFSSPDMFFLEEIKPHIKRALRINQRLKLEQQDEEHLFKLFSHFLDGILLIDARGKVQYTNAAANRLFALSGLLRLNSNKELVAKKAEQTALIQNAVRKILSHVEDSKNNAHQHNILIEDHDFTIKLSILSLATSKSLSHLHQHGFAAAIFLHTPKASHQIAVDLLKQVYNLNSSETMLCAKFVNHPSIEACAEELNLSENSVRTYLKKIYEKTGQNSQAGLMRLLMGYVISID